MCRKSSRKPWSKARSSTSLLPGPGDGAIKAHKSKVPFYQGQRPIVLGKMDSSTPPAWTITWRPAAIRPSNKSFGGISPEAVIEAVDKSGLRGRAVAAFPRAQIGASADRRRGRQISYLQRGRRRPRGLHGPGRHGRRPPRRPGRYDHRRLRHRRQPGLYLRCAMNIHWR